MASSKRVQVFPTRMALATWKDQEKGAAKGEHIAAANTCCTRRCNGNSHGPICDRIGACEELWPRFPAAGYDLLKKKRDALKKRFHTICKTLADVRGCRSAVLLGVLKEPRYD